MGGQGGGGGNAWKVAARERQAGAEPGGMGGAGEVVG